MFQGESSSSPSATSPAIIDHFVVDAGKTNTGKIPVHIENKPEIHVEVKDGKIDNSDVKKKLADAGIKPADMDDIIQQIEREIPTQTPPASN